MYLATINFVLTWLYVLSYTLRVLFLNHNLHWFTYTIFIYMCPSNISRFLTCIQCLICHICGFFILLCCSLLNFHIHICPCNISRFLTCIQCLLCHICGFLFSTMLLLGCFSIAIQLQKNMCLALLYII